MSIKNNKILEQENNHRFLILADNIPGFIAYVNAETLQYEFVNSSFEKSFGIPRDKIIGSHIKKIIGETNYQFALKYINEVRAGKSITYVNTFDLTSGKRWIEVNYSPIYNSNNQVISIAVLSYDITERKLSEEEIKIKNEQLEDAKKNLLSVNVNLTKSKIALEQMETKLRNVLDATPFPVAVVDLMDENIFYWSSSALALFGHTAQTVSEWYQIAFPDPVYRQEVINRWKSFLEKAQKTGKPVNTGEYRVTCKDDSIRICELHATFLSENLIITFNDITERKQLQEALKYKEEIYEDIFNSVSDGIAYTTLTGEVISINKSLERILEIPIENIVGKNILNIAKDLLSAKNILHAIPHLKNLLQGKEFHDLQLEYKNKRLSISTSINTESKRLTGIIRDITEQRLADEEIKIKNEKLNETNNILLTLNEELIQSQKKYQQIIETAIEGVISLDAEGKITFISQQMSAMLGYTIENMIGKKFETFLPEDQLNDHHSQMKIRAQGKDSIYERCIIKKDGSKQWTIISAKSINAANGKSEGSFAMITDITDRKNAEENIQKLLAEKELILREVHHRIKNNMNTIYGLLILQANTLKDQTAISALEDSANRVQSMMALYNKIYLSPDFQKISVSDYLPYLTEEIIKNFSNSNSVNLEHNIENFILDTKRLQPLGIIINELLTNIMKYAFIGRTNGEISISAGLKSDPEKNISIVSIIIHDNGVGMPETVDFENSSGFGLQLVWILTQELQGTIRIERKDGTRVILEFEL